MSFHSLVSTKTASVVHSSSRQHLDTARQLGSGHVRLISLTNQVMSQLENGCVRFYGLNACDVSLGVRF